MLSEISQIEKDTYCIISLIGEIFFFKKYNKLVGIIEKNRLIDIENIPAVISGERERRGSIGVKIKRNYYI